MVLIDCPSFFVNRFENHEKKKKKIVERGIADIEIIIMG